MIAARLVSIKPVFPEVHVAPHPSYLFAFTLPARFSRGGRSPTFANEGVGQRDIIDTTRDRPRRGHGADRVQAARTARGSSTVARWYVTISRNNHSSHDVAPPPARAVSGRIALGDHRRASPFADGPRSPPPVEESNRRRLLIQLTYPKAFVVACRKRIRSTRSSPAGGDGRPSPSVAEKRRRPTIIRLRVAQRSRTGPGRRAQPPRWICPSLPTSHRPLSPRARGTNSY